MSRLTQLARDVARNNPQGRYVFTAPPDWGALDPDRFEVGANWRTTASGKEELYLKSECGVVIGSIIAMPTCDGLPPLTKADYEREGARLLAERVAQKMKSIPQPGSPTPGPSGDVPKEN